MNELIAALHEHEGVAGLGQIAHLESALKIDGRKRILDLIAVLEFAISPAEEV